VAPILPWIIDSTHGVSPLVNAAVCSFHSHIKQGQGSCICSEATKITGFSRISSGFQASGCLLNAALVTSAANDDDASPNDDARGAATRQM